MRTDFEERDDSERETIGGRTMSPPGKCRSDTSYSLKGTFEEQTLEKLKKITLEKHFSIFKKQASDFEHAPVCSGDRRDFVNVALWGGSQEYSISDFISVDLKYDETSGKAKRLLEVFHDAIREAFQSGRTFNKTSRQLKANGPPAPPPDF
jgi:hypothetical protein